MGLFAIVAVGVCVDPWVGTSVAEIMAPVLEDEFDPAMPTDTPTATAATRIMIATMPINTFLGRRQIS